MSSLSRINKLFADRDSMDPASAHACRRLFTVAIRCGNDVANSYTLQLAAITAASLASRCFPGAVGIMLSRTLRDAPFVVWPVLGLTVSQAFAMVAGERALAVIPASASRTLVLGNASADSRDLRISFDGWIAQVGPASQTERLPEREYCPLVAILAAAIGVSETFLSFADISVEAGRRPVRMSLWKPDDTSDAALGIPLEVLPQSLWVLGLGHLGNAYLWALAGLPYPNPDAVRIYLNDFDKVEDVNVEIGILFSPDDEGNLKTRVCDEWLRRRGFVETRMVERHFDENFRRRDIEPREPGLVLCGFDSNPARRCLGTANFLWACESGLGGTFNNFDTVSLHTLPNPRLPYDLWPDLTPTDVQLRGIEHERLARANSAYQSLDEDECGRIQLAGKSVAVPFVGAAAASFVLAESLRLLHGGPAYTDLKFRLAFPGELSVIGGDCYRASAIAGLDYVNVAKSRD